MSSEHPLPRVHTIRDLSSFQRTLREAAKVAGRNGHRLTDPLANLGAWRRKLAVPLRKLGKERPA
eukprot:3537492-Alexandrium_andersonii.AAC.1